MAREYQLHVLKVVGDDQKQDAFEYYILDTKIKNESRSAMDSSISVVVRPNPIPVPIVI